MLNSSSSTFLHNPFSNISLVNKSYGHFNTLKRTNPLGTFRRKHRQWAISLSHFGCSYLFGSVGYRWVQSIRAGRSRSCSRRSSRCSGRSGWRSGWAIARGHRARRGCTAGRGAAHPPPPARTGPGPSTRRTGPCLAQTPGNSLGSTCRSSGTLRLHTVEGTELQLGPTRREAAAGKGRAVWGSAWQRGKQSRLVPRAVCPHTLISPPVVGHPASSMEREKEREKAE